MSSRFPARSAGARPDLGSEFRAGSARRRARLAAGAAAGAAGLLAAAAYAGDRVLTGSISERVVGDTNFQLDPGADGGFGSETSVNLAYADRAGADTLSLRGGLRYAAYTGDVNDNIAGLFPSVSGSWQRLRSDRSLTLNFSGSVRPVEFDSTSFVLLPGDPGDPDVEDPDVEPVVGLVNRNDDTLRGAFSIGAAYSYQVTPNETLDFNTSAQRVDFLDDTGGRFSPSTTLDFGAGWSRNVSSSWNGGISTGVTVIKTDESNERDSVSLFIAPSIGYARTPNQTFNASLGPSVNFLSGGGRSSEVTPGIRASLGAQYVTGPASFRLSLSNSTRPSDDGVTSNVTSFGAAFTRRIDATQSLNASAAASLQTPLGDSTGGDDITRYSVKGGYSIEVNSLTSARAGLAAAYTEDRGGSETAYSANAGLSYRLTEQTSADFGYVFRIEDGDGQPTSHRVSVTLRRDFSLLP
ncbi:MAG: hypothetical protein VYD87_17015 [Pseudomonadota bacterium]|nr:hypothetical protein [Pseudomonadota bacterium]MEE3101309.1 hypothetical protein [Pseudomonadota bacterium]